MKCALLIGITYPNSENYLPGCENDIKDMYEYLQTCGYTKFIVCCDVPDLFLFKTLDTTWNDIQKGFSELISLSKTYHNSECFIHYSGHGTQYKDTNNDELDSKDECIVTRDPFLVTDDILNEILRSICPCSKVFCLMDCCHSGTILDLEYKWDAKTNDFTTENKTEINTNILMISGCMDKQDSVSVLIDNKWQGAQTRAFFEMAKKNYGVKTIEQLYIFCNKYVYRYPQISQISTTYVDIQVNFEENNFNLICINYECNVLKQRRLQKEKEERLQKEKEERLQKEKEEHLQKEKEERLQKEKEEHLQKEKKERLQKEKKERLQKEKKERLQKEKKERLRKERLQKERLRKERLQKERLRRQALLRRRRRQALLRRRRRQALLRRRRRQALLRRRRRQALLRRLRRRRRRRRRR